MHMHFAHKERKRDFIVLPFFYAQNGAHALCSQAKKAKFYCLTFLHAQNGAHALCSQAKKERFYYLTFVIWARQVNW